jgi:uncharacterized protein (DUF362 family)/NAD-dependent dihydropyrimidine dehydrogenase PreA subunit
MTDSDKVAIVKCSDYSTCLEGHVEELFNLLGGIDSFVQPGQSVLIKPNMLTDRDPSLAVTTHPKVVRAIIRLLKKQGAKPSVADSPASAEKLEKVWETTGFESLCKEEDVPLLNLEKSGSKTFSTDVGTYSIASPLLDADVVINVPKVKTHCLTTLTAAVKNMYGIIPGYQKAQLHKQFPSPQEFGMLMADIYSQLPPTINIADAIVGMEGNGPSAGTPKELGFLAASSNAAALDLTLCRILKINPRSVPYLSHLTTDLCDESATEIVGVNEEDVSPTSFLLPGTFMLQLIPNSLIKILSPFLWIRPDISDKCTSCGRCVKSCPVDALSIGAQKAVLEPKKCIGCCCCHEICPEKSIEMTMSPFLRFIRRNKLP